MKIFAADPDEKFLKKLEKQILFGFENVMPVFCSKQELYENDLEENDDADIVLVSEEFYSENISRVSCDSVFVLGNEKKEKKGFGDLSYIYKYDIRAVLEKVISEKNAAGKKNSLVVFCSPSGGTGTTTAAFMTAQALSQFGKKVLFMSLDPLQNFIHLSGDDHFLSEEEGMLLSQGNDHGYETLIRKIKEKNIFFVPPFIRPYISFGISMKDICSFAEYAVQSGNFEYVITDVSAWLSADTAELMAKAEKNIICTGNDSVSRMKYQRFKEAVDLNDRKKFLLLYIGEMTEPFTENVPASETVPFSDINEMKAVNPYKRLALFI